MKIQQMFKRDINRYINGVISVGEDDTVKQELEEYVVTRELQRHFGDFFEAYEKGLDNPARNVGVWIQGYFGSGKSHFLKMLREEASEGAWFASPDCRIRDGVRAR